MTRTKSAIELPAVPAKMYGPHMVENQCQLRLISQSKAPKVRQSAKSGRPTKDAFPHPDRELRIAVAILADGKPAKQVGDDRECDKKEDARGRGRIPSSGSRASRPEPDRFRAAHPSSGKDISPKPDRQKENTQDRKEKGNVFELSPNDDGPFRVDHMMHDGPEETADAEGEEKDEGEEPGKAELDRRSKRPDKAKDKYHDADQSTKEWWCGAVVGPAPDRPRPRRGGPGGARRVGVPLGAVSRARPERDRRLVTAGAAPRILVVDHHDSFVFTLVSYLRELGAEVNMVEGDDLGITALLARAEDADGVLVSPGPGRPEDVPASTALVQRAEATGRPLLGVCLGHQVLAHALGARVTEAPELLHGRTGLRSSTDGGSGFFDGLPSGFAAMRYHSLAVDGREPSRGAAG